MLAWVPVLGFTRNAGKAGESDPGPHLEEAPGGWESQRGIGCLPGHRVGFITASDGDSSRLKASSSLTRLLTSDMLLRLTFPKSKMRTVSVAPHVDVKNIRPADTRSTPGLVAPIWVVQTHFPEQ